MIGTKLFNTSWGQFNLWPQDGICKSLIEGKFWDKHLKETFDTLPKNSTIIDVGANIGFMSIYLAKLGHRVVAFEPCRQTFDVLVSNIKLNDVEENVMAFNVALYNKETKVRLFNELFVEKFKPIPFNNNEIDFTSWDHIGGFSLIESTTGELITKTLDSFGIENVTLIKIDAQGCDLKIMKGAVETIKKYRPKIIFEFEPPIAYYHNEDFDIDYKTFITGIGYNLKLLNDPTDCFYDYLAYPV
jgi:FkbM family methyltransferase